jgi:hypothetical protein
VGAPPLANRRVDVVRFGRIDVSRFEIVDDCRGTEGRLAEAGEARLV